MRHILIGGALALAACGQDETKPAELIANAAAPAAVAARVSAVGGQAGNIANDAGKLTGATSALTGDTSALVVRLTDTSRIVELPTDTLFAFDSATLEPGATGNLDKTATLIRGAAPGAIEVLGHTDSKGSDDYNLALSGRRAEAVAAWLRQQVGVRQRAIASAGRGETDPIAPNMRADGSDDPDGRAKNRRVEVVVPR